MPRWSTSTMSRSRRTPANTDTAAQSSGSRPGPGPPAIRNSGSGLARVATAGTTATRSSMRAPAGVVRVLRHGEPAAARLRWRSGRRGRRCGRARARSAASPRRWAGAEQRADHERVDQRGAGADGSAVRRHGADFGDRGSRGQPLTKWRPLRYHGALHGAVRRHRHRRRPRRHRGRARGGPHGRAHAAADAEPRDRRRR